MTRLTSSSAVTVYCIHCGNMFPVSKALQQKSVKCPDCSASLVVPDGTEGAKAQRQLARAASKRFVARAVVLLILLVGSPLAIIELVSQLYAGAHHQPPEWWLILAWYFGIWLGGCMVIGAGLGPEVTYGVDHQNVWGETVARSTVRTGEYEFRSEPTSWITIWSYFYLGLPSLAWGMLKFGIIHF